MASGFGGGSHGQLEARALKMQKEREKQMKEFEDRKKKIRDEQRMGAGHHDPSKKFSVQESDDRLEANFQKATEGLMDIKTFTERRGELLKRQSLLGESERIEMEEKEDAQKLAEKRKRAEEKVSVLGNKKRLSFADDDDEEEEEEEEDEDDGPMAMAKHSFKGKKGFGKDKSINTAFLPDRDREREDLQLKERFQVEWHNQQNKLRSEPLEITYSYWDGTGHRRAVEVTKGTTIGQFLEECRKMLVDTGFRELRAASSETLMYIKEDLIIPNHLTFYDLIVTQARGKSGPLFHFDVHDDVRLNINAKVEKEDSHAGKIVERHWYERNRHIFPASRWETYDPHKVYGSYTIHGPGGADQTKIRENAPKIGDKLHNQMGS